MSNTKHIAAADLRQRLKSTLSDQQIRKTSKMAELNSKFVPFDRDDLLRAAIETLFENALEEPKEEFQEGLLLLVTGASGAGKSRSIGQALKRKQRMLGEGADDLFVEVSAPSPCTSKQLAICLLHGMGYPIQRDLQENVAWQRVRELLVARKPLMLWIDEMQHVVDGLQSIDEVKKMHNTIKSIVQLKVWPPVSIVMSGLPMLVDFAKMDAQIQRRTHEVVFDAIRFPEDVADVRRVVGGIIGHDVGLQIAQELTTDEFLARLCHCVSGAFGLAIKLTRAAAVEAFGWERNVACIDDFAMAYRMATGRSDAENPFLVDNWHKIRPWYADSEAKASAGSAKRKRKVA